MFGNITYFQAGALLISCIVASRLVRALFDPLRSIPGPFAARFTKLWYARQLSSGKSRWTEIDLHRKYGSVIRLAPNQYSIDNLEAARQLYGQGTKFTKSDWYLTWDSTVVDRHGFRDVFSIQDPHFHHEQRKIINNLYSMSNLVQMESCVDETTSLLIKAFDGFSQNRKEIDLHHWMLCYAFDVIMFITLNKRYGLLDRDGDDEGFFKNFGGQTDFATVAGVYPTFFWYFMAIVIKLPIPQPFKRIIAFAERQMDEYARKYDAKEEIDSIELDEKSVLHRGTVFYQKNPEKFPKSALKTVALMNIFAGSDTTGIALTAILHFLNSFPETLAKLRTEIRENKAQLGIGNKSFSYQQAQKMPYLQAAIKESMRLYSPVGMTLPWVVPPGGATLAGRHFPAGTEVGINAWVAHRNPEVFGSDADEFRPERWLHDDADSAEKISNMDAYMLHFGQGSRTCIGKNISMLEISKVLPEIVIRYDLEFTDEALLKDPQRGIATAGGWFVEQHNMQCKVKPTNAKA